VHAGKYLFDTFPTHSGLVVKFALEYSSRNVRENQNGIIFKRTNHLLVYANRVNLLIGDVSPQEHISPVESNKDGDLEIKTEN
jgi:hypothetical protein